MNRNKPKFKESNSSSRSRAALQSVIAPVPSPKYSFPVDFVGES